MDCGGGVTRDFLTLIAHLSDSIRGVVQRNITAGTSNLAMGIGLGRTRVVLAGISGNLSLSGVLLYRLYNLSLSASFALISRDRVRAIIVRRIPSGTIGHTVCLHPRLHSLTLTRSVCGSGIGIIHSRVLPSLTLANKCVISGPSLLGNFRGGFHKV